MNIKAITTNVSKAYLQAGVFVGMGAVSGLSFADTAALTGGNRQGQSKAGDSIGDIQERATGGMNSFMEFAQLGCMFLGFILFVLAILDFTKIGKPGSDATAPKAIGKLAVGIVLAVAGYFFWSGANSAAGNTGGTP